MQQAEEQEVPQGRQDSANGWHNNVKLVSADNMKFQGKVLQEIWEKGSSQYFKFLSHFVFSFLQLHFCPTSHHSYLGLPANGESASSERSCAQHIALGSPWTTSTGRGHPCKQRKMTFLQGHKIFSSEEEEKKKKKK